MGPADETPSRTAHEVSVASENHDRAQLCMHLQALWRRNDNSAEVTTCMILRRTAPSPSTVTEPKWIVTVDCQRDSSKTNARHREIASTKVYPGNALSPLCRCVYAGQDGLHGRKHKRHCSLLSCRELVTTCHTSNRTTVERRPTRASSVL